MAFLRDEYKYLKLLSDNVCVERIKIYALGFVFQIIAFQDETYNGFYT